MFIHTVHIHIQIICIIHFTCTNIYTHTNKQIHHGATGWDAARRIREMEKARGEKYPLPIVGVIGAATPLDADKCLEAGMTDTIMKPINVDVLVRGVERYCSMHVFV